VREMGKRRSQFPLYAAAVPTARCGSAARAPALVDTVSSRPREASSMSSAPGPLRRRCAGAVRGHIPSIEDAMCGRPYRQILCVLLQHHASRGLQYFVRPYRTAPSSAFFTEPTTSSASMSLASAIRRGRDDRLRLQSRPRIHRFSESSAGALMPRQRALLQPPGPRRPPGLAVVVVQTSDEHCRSRWIPRPRNEHRPLQIVLLVSRSSPCASGH